MRKILFSAFILIFFMVTGAYSQFPKYLYGIISWYGDDFTGKKTASGDLYDPQKYTAAHRALPFGTQIEVENLESGKKVTLTVNDRGPFVESRVLDVSRKAAEDLGITKKGTVYAKITIIRLGDNKTKDTPATNNVFANTNASAQNTNKAPLPVPVSNAAPAASPAAVPVAPVSVPAAPAAPVSPVVLPSVVLTNMVTIKATNFVNVTNFIPVPVTNVISVQPYTEKTNEFSVPVVSNEQNLISSGSDEFIMDEPIEAVGVTPPPLPPAGSDLTQNLPPLINPDKGFSDNEITPEILLSNETAVKLEQKEIQGEASKELSKIDKSISYIIQAGAFSKEKNAMSLYDQLRKKGFPVFTTEDVIKKKKYIRVRIGYYESADLAKKDLDKLTSMKLKGTIIKVKN